MPGRIKTSSAGFSGLRVIAFESRMAFEMEGLIRRHGGDPFVAPAMREIPLELNREASQFARKLLDGQTEIVIFMTGVGTRFLMQVMEKEHPRERLIRALSKTLLVARGPKPAAVLKEMGLKTHVAVPAPNTWKEILSALDGDAALKDKKVFVQEYGMENRDFIAALKKRGAHVSRLPIYRWALPEDTSPLRSALSDVVNGRADVLLFTNATQIHHVLQIAAEDGLENSFRESLERAAVASIGPVMSENLRDCGVAVDFEAREAKLGLFIKEAAERCPQILADKRIRWQEKSRRVSTRCFEVKPYDARASQASPFLAACRGEKTSCTPVWLMRQAGRYMKEYRDVRSKVSFLELCKTPDLACEVTVTAQEKLGADAAIIFSDILVVLEPMGVGLEYVKEEGPLIHRPVRGAEDVRALLRVQVEDSLDFVLEAIRKTRSALKPDIPLIGFAGAPFTIASYLIEGKGSTHYLHTKNLMYRDPAAWDLLMGKVVKVTSDYLNAQAAAGAQALQIFDSWVGCLSPSDYREHILPHMKKLFGSLKKEVPVIHFGTGTGALLELMQEAGGHVIGLDWRVELGAARKRLGKTPVQGNLDPHVLLADIKTIRRKTEEILKQSAGKPGHIFNLGHGVLPQTPVENAAALIDIVHEWSSKRSG